MVLRGVTIIPGVIDSDYVGKFSIIVSISTTLSLLAGEHIAQILRVRPIYYYSQGFYTLSYTYSKVKNAESIQHSISNNFHRYQIPSCKSLIFCTSSSIPEAC